MGIHHHAHGHHLNPHPWKMANTLTFVKAGEEHKTTALLTMAGIMDCKMRGQLGDHR